MTTIAYVNGVMAADSQMTRGREICLGARKIFRTDNFIVGVSGDYSNLKPLENFFEYIDSGGLGFIEQVIAEWEKAPSYGEGYTCLIATKGGEVYYSNDTPPFLIPRSFEAIGSGASFAIGSMAYGAGARKALEIACSLDIHTGGEIQTESFNENADVHPIRV